MDSVLKDMKIFQKSISKKFNGQKHQESKLMNNLMRKLIISIKLKKKFSCFKNKQKKHNFSINK